MSNMNLLASLRFDGRRFDGHAMDIDCVGELKAYKELVLECAKHIWLRKHTDKTRLPKGFDENLILQFKEVGEGSAAIPVLRVKPQPKSGTNGNFDFNEYDEFDEAAELVDLAIAAAGNDQLLPDAFPRNVIPLFQNFGKSLRQDETVYIKCRKHHSESAYNATARKRLSEWTETTYEDRIDIIGEVSMANVRGGAFQLLVTTGQTVGGKFTAQQEVEVLEALREHKTARLRVTGTGEFSSSDKMLKRFVAVESVALARSEAEFKYENVKPIWEIVSGIGESLPESAWSDVPTDLSQKLDDYLYSGKERG